MRHKGINKEQTRQKMLEATVQGFRKHGYAGIGVDGLAKAGGVTSGAFYAHFGSKDGAFKAALTAGLNEVIVAIPEFQAKFGTDWVKAFADYYLGKPHRNDLASSCAMATLTTEVVRFGADIHADYEKKMAVIATLIADGLAGGSDEERRDRGWSMLGILIGGVNIARAMKSNKAAEEVAGAIKASAIKAAGRTHANLKGTL
ncbi:MAG: TetR/AcrR family transcriptional regulator [Thiohalomonadales bacterium]